jgi:amino acid transporter
MGSKAIWAWLAAALFSGMIMACFAEVASRFDQSGGPYLYARAAFGRFAGILVGWLLLLVRLASAGAAANLFVTYLGEFWSRSTEPLPRLAVLSLLVGIIGYINYRGMGPGTRLSNVFTVAKLLPLGIFILVGAVYLASQKARVSVPAIHTGIHSWLNAMPLLVFSFGGFEGALLPLAEAKDPQRDAPFGLMTALIVCTVIYTSVQAVVMWVLPNAGASDRPLAATANLFLGEAGAVFMAIAAMVSVYGYLAAQILSLPRLTFALAEGGDFPRFFAAIHSKFHTPFLSITVLTAILWGLACYGSFEWNAVLSAIARLVYYALICATVPIFRRKDPDGARFRIPFANFIAATGIAVCLIFATAMQLSSLLILATVVLIALLNWVWAKKKFARTPEQL